MISFRQVDPDQMDDIFFHPELCTTTPPARRRHQGGDKRVGHPQVFQIKSVLLNTSQKYVLPGPGWIQRTFNRTIDNIS